MMCPDVDIKYHWTPAALYELKTQALLRKWKASCLRTSYSSLLACPDCAVSARVLPHPHLPHPHLLLRCPGNVPRPRQPHGAGWRVTRTLTRMLAAGGVQHARLVWGMSGDHCLVPQHLNLYLGPTLNFWPPSPSKQTTVLTFGVSTCGKVLYGASYFRVALYFLGMSQVILWLLKISWAKW